MNTTQTRREAIRRYQDGEKGTTIAIDLGVSYGSVYRWVRQAGIQTRMRGRPRSPRAHILFALHRLRRNSRVAKEFGVRRQHIENRLLLIGFDKAAWLALPALSAEDEEIVRQCLDDDGLDFPDMMEVLADHRSMSSETAAHGQLAVAA